jgi:lysophospholipase L1-like esterase
MTPFKYWTTDGFEISSYQYHLSDRVNNSFKTSGSDNTEKCIYTYNSLGFRGDEPTKEGFKIMCIGDSNTEGVGVNDIETWPAQFTKLVPNGVNHNFGVGGRSNDYISRCLLTYYDLIKPDLVLIMYTSPQRREIYTKEGGIEPFIPTLSWGYFQDTFDGSNAQSMLFKLQNNNEDFINWYKNHLLIKYFLETKKCNWLWNGWFDIPNEYEEFNRYDWEYRIPFTDTGADGIHPGKIHNKEYSIKLYNHIYKNFRNYLPDDIEPLKTTLI